LFADLKRQRENQTETLANSPDVRTSLAKILELAPNHESARYLLSKATGDASKTLSINASLYEFSTAAYPYRAIFSQQDNMPRSFVPSAVTSAARKRINQLRPIANRAVQPLLTSFSHFVDVEEWVRTGSSTPTELANARDSVVTELDNLQANPEIIEKLVREGF
jgi:hypothetical protein